MSCYFPGSASELAEALLLFAKLEAARHTLSRGIAELEEDGRRAGGEEHLIPMDQAGLSRLRGKIAAVELQIREIRRLVPAGILPADG